MGPWPNGVPSRLKAFAANDRKCLSLCLVRGRLTTKQALLIARWNPGFLSERFRKEVNVLSGWNRAHQHFQLFQAGWRFDTLIPRFCDQVGTQVVGPTRLKRSKHTETTALP